MWDLPPCVEQVAEVYQLPVELLQAIHKMEGGRPGTTTGPNRNGTYDLGPMQINTIWLPELKKHGITREHLLKDGCTNIAVGAWVYRQSLNRYGDYEKAAASYNAGYNLKAGRGYARKLMKIWRGISSTKQAKNSSR